MSYTYKKIKDIKQENENMYIIGYFESDHNEGEGNTIQRFDRVNDKCPAKLISFNDNYAFFEIIEECHVKYGAANKNGLQVGDIVMIDLNGDLYKLKELNT